MLNKPTAITLTFISAVAAIVYLADAVFFNHMIMYIPFVAWSVCALIWANIVNLLKDN